MQPRLGLVYDSQGGNTYYGLGWALDGLSSISFANRDVYRHNWAGAVNLDGNDPLTLDGNHLILVSGDYGRNGSVYRTETETFSSIELTGDLSATTCFFTVTAKSGLVNKYEPVLFTEAGDRGLVFSLTQTTDVYGNYMKYGYNQTNSRELLLTDIYYTGNTATGLQPYNHVQLIYDSQRTLTDRIDKNVYYIHGNSVKITSLLNEVRIINEHNTITKTYTLDYAKNTTATTLQTVSEWAGEAANRPPKLNDLVFHYGDEEYALGWVAKAVENEPLPMPGTGELTGDFNGDGYADILTYHKHYWTEPKLGYVVGAGSGCNVWAASNDNSQESFFYDRFSIGLGSLHDNPNNPLGFRSPNNSSHEYGLPYSTERIACTPLFDTAHYKTICSANNIVSTSGDFDGDGKDDVVSVVTRPRSLYDLTHNLDGGYLGEEIAGVQIQTKIDQGAGSQTQFIPMPQLSDVTHLTIPTLLINADFPNFGYAWDDRGINVVETGDYDGDGRMDIAVITRAKLYWKNATTGQPPIYSSLSYDPLSMFISPSSIVVMVGLASNQHELKRVTIDNNDYIPVSSNAYPPISPFINFQMGFADIKKVTTQTIDIDGDRKSELVISTINGAHILNFNKFDPTTNKIEAISTHGSQIYGGHNIFPIPFPIDKDDYFADFNGDGKTDIFHSGGDNFSIDGNPGRVFYSTGTGFSADVRLPASSVRSGYTNERKFIIADFNGDGKADILTAVKRPDDHYLFVYYATGLDF
jgi:FG-GAP-like repeat